jgi:hypothetical protein
MGFIDELRNRMRNWILSEDQFNDAKKVRLLAYELH